MTGNEHVDNLKTIPALGGLNRFSTLNNTPPEDFYGLINLIHQYDGVLQSPPGIKPRALVSGKRILSIHQTNDKRENVIVQTSDGVYIFSEDELFERMYAPALTPITILEEETFMKGIITDQRVANTDSGVNTVAAAWTTAPLSAIVSQLNPDGTAAAFITALAANVFTLAIGVYRFRIRCAVAGTAGDKYKGRLFNVTAGAAAWVGLANETGEWEDIKDANSNLYTVFGGDLQIAAPTQFRIEIYAGTAGAPGKVNGMGRKTNIGGLSEVYRWIEIIKTA